MLDIFLNEVTARANHVHVLCLLPFLGLLGVGISSVYKRDFLAGIDKKTNGLFFFSSFLCWASILVVLFHLLFNFEMLLLFAWIGAFVAVLLSFSVLVFHWVRKNPSDSRESKREAVLANILPKEQATYYAKERQPSLEKSYLDDCRAPESTNAISDIFKEEFPLKVIGIDGVFIEAPFLPGSFLK